MHCCCGMVGRTQQREFIRMGRHAGEDLRDLNSGNVGFDGLEGPADGSRRVRLHIPGIQLAGATHQHQMDTVHILAALHRTRRLEAEEVGHRQPQEAERSRVQKIPPADTVTEMHSLVSIQSKHRNLSQSGRWGIIESPPQDVSYARWRYVPHYTLLPLSHGSSC